MKTFNTKEKLYRTFGFSVKDAGEDGKVGYIEGYASTFGNVDQGLDIVDSGAFKKSIKEQNSTFPILLDHCSKTPIGWNIEAAEDKKGLKVKGRISLETEEARNRYQLAKWALELGTNMGLSIGYSIIKAEPDPANMMITHLTELKLWEYSLVVFPMNVEAGIDEVKNLKLKILFDELKNSPYSESVIKALVDLGIANPDLQAATTQFEPELIHSVDKLIDMLRV